jgi:broad specificity phosphatase PhoE
VRGVPPDPGPDGGLGDLNRPGGASPADLSRPTTLLLVRHARTGHTGGVLSGGDDDGPPLTADGEREAASVARYLAGLAPAGPGDRDGDDVLVRPDAVVCSPIVRTRQTAAPLAGRLGVEARPDPGWRELMFGAWHGLPMADVARRWPGALRTWRRDSAQAPPGGESLDDLVARAAAARDRAVTAHPGRCVAVVSHLAPIRAVLAAALDAGPAAMWRLRVEPASVSVLRIWADGGVEVAGVNLTSHLREVAPAAEVERVHGLPG